MTSAFFRYRYRNVWDPLAAPLASQPGSNRIDLGQQGLSQGDYIDPYVDQHFHSGNTVYVPPGEYRLGDAAISGWKSNCSLIGDPAGVVLHRDTHSHFRQDIRAESGTVRVANLTIRGRGQASVQGEHSRWGVAAESGARAEGININQPDGSESHTDDSAWYAGQNTGTALLKNCYAAHFGNSCFYVNTGSGPVIMDNCVTVDSLNNRPGNDNSVYRNCTMIWRNQPPAYWDGGSRYARGFRMDHGGHNITFENCHFYWGPGIDGGASINLRDQSDTGPTSGVCRDIFIETHTDAGGIDLDQASASDWTFENINIVGPGNASAPVPTGNTPPDLTITPANGSVAGDMVWMPEGQTYIPGSGPVEPECQGDADCPPGFVCDSGQCVVAVPGDLAILTVNSTRGSSSSRNTFEYRLVVQGYIEQHPDDVESNDTVAVINENPLRMEATGETGNGGFDRFRMNGTIEAAEITRTLEGPTVSPGNGMNWTVGGQTMTDPVGQTIPDGGGGNGGGQGCQADSECPDGQVCRDGVCVDAGDGQRQSNLGALAILGVAGAAAYRYLR